MMIYLEPGENIIRTSEKFESKKNCGLIPIGSKVEKIQTQGLKYNFGNVGDPIDSLDFRDMISTSNSIVGEEVHITTSHAILFCTSLNTENF